MSRWWQTDERVWPTSGFSWVELCHIARRRGVKSDDVEIVTDREWLHIMRWRAGLSLAELARQIGRSPNWISRAERGKTKDASSLIAWWRGGVHPITGLELKQEWADNRLERMERIYESRRQV